jgi:hypothetical protein
VLYFADLSNVFASFGVSTLRLTNTSTSIFPTATLTEFGACLSFFTSTLTFGDGLFFGVLMRTSTRKKPFCSSFIFSNTLFVVLFTAFVLSLRQLGCSSESLVLKPLYHSLTEKSSTFIATLEFFVGDWNRVK